MSFLLNGTKNVSKPSGQVLVYLEENQEKPLLCKPLLAYKTLQQADSSMPSSFQQTVYKDYLLSSEAFLLPSAL
jgi:hypothetical protein